MDHLTESGTLLPAQAETPAAPPMTAPEAPPRMPGADAAPEAPAVPAAPAAGVPAETGPGSAGAGGAAAGRTGSDGATDGAAVDAAPGGSAGSGGAAADAAPAGPAVDAAPAGPAVDAAPAGPAVDVSGAGAGGADPSGAAAPDLPPLELTGLPQVDGAFDQAREFLVMGGPAIWAIAALSVLTVALILWKIWRLALLGAWSKGKARQALRAFEAGRPDVALQIVEGRRGLRSRVVSGALRAWASLPEAAAREETARVAQQELASARGGLRALELIASIAPLLGLLGTVLGMIAAFRTLQEAGSRADPAMLAGGIWEALLTTAAGMAVAIPASAALTWFESVIERIRLDVEDAATRIFVAPQRIQPQAMAA